MRIAYNACCFRFTLEVFLPGIELRKYEVIPRERLPELKRKLARQLARELKRNFSQTAATDEYTPK